MTNSNDLDASFLMLAPIEVRLADPKFLLCRTEEASLQYQYHRHQFSCDRSTEYFCPESIITSCTPRFGGTVAS